MVFGCVVVVVSHPLQVLPHSLGNFSHKPPFDNVWHLAKENVFVLLKHLCFVDVVVVELLVVVDDVEVDVVEVVDRDVEDVVVDVVLVVVDVVDDVVVVVVSHPLQVLAQFVMLAT